MGYKRKIVGFTPRAAQLILERYVEVIDFHPMLISGAMKLSEKTFRFMIYIANILQEREGQKKTLIHELIHIFCLLKNIRVSEKTIEAETERFYEQHPRFCERIFCRIEDNKREEPTVFLPSEWRKYGYGRQLSKVSRYMFKTGTRRQMKLRFTHSFLVT